MTEIRKDIITGNLVIFSPQRGKRPHDFKLDVPPKTEKECPFCPGNESMTPPEVLEYRNNSGWLIRSVPNLYSALSKDNKQEIIENNLYRKFSAIGTAEVFIETPDHDSTLGTHPFEQVVNIIKGLKQRYIDLKKDKDLKYIQIFKNFGLAGGASKEHAHWQIMSLAIIPPVVNTELEGAKKYFSENKSCPYCDTIKKEIEEKERVVINSDKFIAICPYVSRFAYETWIFPKNHKSKFEEIKKSEIEDFAKVLQEIIRKFERGFNLPPYNIVLHTLPIDFYEEEYYHWHIEILPRLTIFAGFEWGTGVIINPTPPELAAQSLREI